MPATDWTQGRGDSAGEGLDAGEGCRFRRWTGSSGSGCPARGSGVEAGEGGFSLPVRGFGGEGSGFITMA